MSHDAPYRFSNEQLRLILDQSGIYMCACPAQVVSQMLELRKLQQYQLDCISASSVPPDTHRCIAQAAQGAHALLEDALDEVLQIEGWDRDTLTMPAGLRALRDSLL